MWIFKFICLYFLTELANTRPIPNNYIQAYYIHEADATTSTEYHLPMDPTSRLGTTDKDSALAADFLAFHTTPHASTYSTPYMFYTSEITKPTLYGYDSKPSKLSEFNNITQYNAGLSTILGSYDLKAEPLDYGTLNTAQIEDLLRMIQKKAMERRFYSAPLKPTDEPIHFIKERSAEETKPSFAGNIKKSSDMDNSESKDGQDRNDNTESFTPASSERTTDLSNNQPLVSETLPETIIDTANDTTTITTTLKHRNVKTKAHKNNVRPKKHYLKRNDYKIENMTNTLSSISDTVFNILDLYENMMSSRKEISAKPIKRHCNEKLILSKQKSGTLSNLKLKYNKRDIFNNGEVMPEAPHDVSEDKQELATSTPFDVMIDNVVEPETTRSLSLSTLTEKMAYNDYINGYKYYLNYQRELGKEHFSDLIKYQAHKHHKVDDIGKFILEKLPHVPEINREKRKFIYGDSMDDQDTYTKADDSWFKKHFYLFIDSGSPKKFHTSQTVPMKTLQTKANINKYDAAEEKYPAAENDMVLKRKDRKYRSLYTNTFFEGKTLDYEANFPEIPSGTASVRKSSIKNFFHKILKIKPDITTPSSSFLINKELKMENVNYLKTKRETEKGKQSQGPCKLNDFVTINLVPKRAVNHAKKIKRKPLFSRFNFRHKRRKEKKPKQRRQIAQRPSRFLFKKWKNILRDNVPTISTPPPKTNDEYLLRNDNISQFDTKFMTIKQEKYKTTSSDYPKAEFPSFTFDNVDLFQQPEDKQLRNSPTSSSQNIPTISQATSSPTNPYFQEYTLKTKEFKWPYNVPEPSQLDSSKNEPHFKSPYTYKAPESQYLNVPQTLNETMNENPLQSSNANESYGKAFTPVGVSKDKLPMTFKTTPAPTESWTEGVDVFPDNTWQAYSNQGSHASLPTRLDFEFAKKTFTKIDDEPEPWSLTRIHMYKTHSTTPGYMNLIYDQRSTKRAITPQEVDVNDDTVLAYDDVDLVTDALEVVPSYSTTWGGAKELFPQKEQQYRKSNQLFTTPIPMKINEFDKYKVNENENHALIDKLGYSMMPKFNKFQRLFANPTMIIKMDRKITQNAVRDVLFDENYNVTKAIADVTNDENGSFKEFNEDEEDIVHQYKNIFNSNGNTLSEHSSPVSTEALFKKNDSGTKFSSADRNKATLYPNFTHQAVPNLGRQETVNWGTLERDKYQNSKKMSETLRNMYKEIEKLEKTNEAKETTHADNDESEPTQNSKLKEVTTVLKKHYHKTKKYQVETKFDKNIDMETTKDTPKSTELTPSVKKLAATPSTSKPKPGKVQISNHIYKFDIIYSNLQPDNQDGELRKSSGKHPVNVLRSPSYRVALVQVLSKYEFKKKPINTVSKKIEDINNSKVFSDRILKRYTKEVDQNVKRPRRFGDALKFWKKKQTRKTTTELSTVANKLHTSKYKDVTSISRRKRNKMNIARRIKPTEGDDCADTKLRRSFSVIEMMQTSFGKVITTTTSTHNMENTVIGKMLKDIEEEQTTTPSIEKMEKQLKSKTTRSFSNLQLYKPFSDAIQTLKIINKTNGKSKRNLFFPHFTEKDVSQLDMLMKIKRNKEKNNFSKRKREIQLILNSISGTKKFKKESNNVTSDLSTTKVYTNMSPYLCDLRKLLNNKAFKIKKINSPLEILHELDLVDNASAKDKVLFANIEDNSVTTTGLPDISNGLYLIIQKGGKVLLNPLIQDTVSLTTPIPVASTSAAGVVLSPNFIVSMQSKLSKIYDVLLHNDTAPRNMRFLAGNSTRRKRNNDRNQDFNPSKTKQFAFRKGRTNYNVNVMGTIVGPSQFKKATTLKNLKKYKYEIQDILDRNPTELSNLPTTMNDTFDDTADLVQQEITTPASSSNNIEHHKQIEKDLDSAIDRLTGLTVNILHNTLAIRNSIFNAGLEMYDGLTDYPETTTLKPRAKTKNIEIITTRSMREYSTTTPSLTSESDYDYENFDKDIAPKPALSKEAHSHNVNDKLPEAGPNSMHKLESANLLNHEETTKQFTNEAELQQLKGSNILSKKLSSLFSNKYFNDAGVRKKKPVKRKFNELKESTKADDTVESTKKEIENQLDKLKEIHKEEKKIREKIKENLEIISKEKAKIKAEELKETKKHEDKGNEKKDSKPEKEEKENKSEKPVKKEKDKTNKKPEKQEQKETKPELKEQKEKKTETKEKKEKEAEKNKAKEKKPEEKVQNEKKTDVKEQKGKKPEIKEQKEKKTETTEKQEKNCEKECKEKCNETDTNKEKNKHSDDKYPNPNSKDEKDEDYEYESDKPEKEEKNCSKSEKEEKNCSEPEMKESNEKNSEESESEKEQSSPEEYDMPEDKEENHHEKSEREGENCNKNSNEPEMKDDNEKNIDAPDNNEEKGDKPEIDEKKEKDHHNCKEPEEEENRQGEEDTGKYDNHKNEKKS